MFARILSILRLKRAILYPFVENHVYTTRYGLAKGLKRRGGLGFIPQITRLRPEEKFLMNLDLNGQIIYDVGAANGIFTLFFAKSVGKKGGVVAFEPNPKFSRQIVGNVELNRFKNVKVLQIALGKERKRERIAFPSGQLGIGSLEKHEKTRILSKKGAMTVEVQVDSIDHIVANGYLPKPDFVKIDVQGLELDVLLGMSRIIRICKPKIFVEVHYIPYVDWKIYNAAKILKFLVATGYSIYHVESGRMLGSCDAQAINENDHLYCF